MISLKEIVCKIFGHKPAYYYDESMNCVCLRCGKEHQYQPGDGPTIKAGEVMRWLK